VKAEECYFDCTSYSLNNRLFEGPSALSCDFTVVCKNSPVVLLLTNKSNQANKSTCYLQLKVSSFQKDVSKTVFSWRFLCTKFMMPEIGVFWSSRGS